MIRLFTMLGFASCFLELSYSSLLQKFEISLYVGNFATIIFSWRHSRLTGNSSIAGYFLYFDIGELCFYHQLKNISFRNTRDINLRLLPTLRFNRTYYAIKRNN
jgi:hypothetical protein